MRIPLIAALLCCILPALAIADPTEPELMAQGQRAYVTGDFDTAKQAFGEVLMLDPNNTLAIQFLRAIRAKEAAMPPATSGGVSGLVLPQVTFKDATFSSALDSLKQAAAKQSVAVSFVSQLPPAQQDAKVTLNLGQIPFLEALRYLCTLNNAAYKIDRYAILITPATAASPAPEASPQ